MVGLVTLIAATCVVGPQKSSPNRAPVWLDTRLAGYVLAYDERYQPVGVFDAITGYHLVRAVDCDGAHLTLILTRDRRVVSNCGYRVRNHTQLNLDEGHFELTRKRLPGLTTGKGIRIGDSPERVRGRLGKPTTAGRTGARKQFLEYTYLWRDVKNGEGTEWANTYTFKAGKLIEVIFSRDFVPG